MFLSLLRKILIARRRVADSPLAYDQTLAQDHACKVPPPARLPAAPRAFF